MSAMFDSATPWTVAHQVPLSLEFSRPECWSGLPFPTPGDLPDPVIELGFLASPALRAESSLSEPPGSTKPFNASLLLILLKYHVLRNSLVFQWLGGLPGWS